MKSITMSALRKEWHVRFRISALIPRPRRVLTMLIVTNSVDARWLRWIFLGATIMGTSLEAQQPRRAPKEIAQMVDAALQAVIPAEKTLDQFIVAERGVRFDFGLTMAAFGYEVDDSTARSSLNLQRGVAPGAHGLLSDCSQTGMKPCKLLGKAIYVSVRPLSTTDAKAVLWLTVRWVGTSSTRAFMSGFSTEVYLSRSGSGPWKFDRTGKTLVL
jgi:hypothetical protein